MGPSTPDVILDEEGNVIDSKDGDAPIQFVFEDIHWTSEVSHQEAAQRLDVTFYPFKKVNTKRLLSMQLTLAQEITLSSALFQVSYLPFSEAFERAEEEKKLVHSILLWGALDDQSCWGEIFENFSQGNSPALQFQH